MEPITESRKLFDAIVPKRIGESPAPRYHDMGELISQKAENNKVKKLGELVAEYYTSKPFAALSNNSKMAYRTSLNYLIECVGHDADVGTAIEKMNAFVSFMERKGLSGWAIRYRLKTVRIFLNRFGYDINYHFRVKREEVQAKKIQRQKRWFSDEEIEVILDYKFLWASDPLHFKTVVRLFIETGARLREMASVTWKEVNIDGGMLFLGESKTEPRPAFFSPETATMLRRMQKGIIGELNPSANVFKSAKEIYEGIATMLADLKFKQDKDQRGPHTFRHYTATKLFYDGDMRIEDVATLLGDTPNTIISTYLHPSPRMLKERVARAWGWKAPKKEELSSEDVAYFDAKEALIKLGFSNIYVSKILDAAMETVTEMTAENLVKAALTKKEDPK